MNLIQISVGKEITVLAFDYSNENVRGICSKNRADHYYILFDYQLNAIENNILFSLRVLLISIDCFAV